MWHSGLTKMIDVDFPLFAFSHCRDVVVEVTNAGGCGVLGAVGYSPDQLEQELRWIDERVGGRPYGVDILVPATATDVDAAEVVGAIPAEHWGFVDDLMSRHGVAPVPRQTRTAELEQVAHQVMPTGAEDLIEVALSHPISLIASALGTAPDSLIQAAGAASVPVAALVGSVKHAQRQVASGVDLIVAQGTEAGGHTGEISTMVLVPQVVDAVGATPVLAAGGIATGRQVAAAMALGAAGAWCGSVWLTTHESEIPPFLRDKLLAASSSDTVRSRSRTGKPARQLAGPWTRAWDSADSPGPLPLPLQMVVGQHAMALIERAAESGNDAAAALTNYFVGQCVGLMSEAKSTKTVVGDIMEEFADTLGAMTELLA